MAIDWTDVEGALRAYLTAYPGLCGRGNPVTNGVHLVDVRSPSSGVVAEQTLTSRNPDHITDRARFSWRVRAVGSEEGARLVAQRAAVALARAVDAIRGVTVTTRAGETVRLYCAGDMQGPTPSSEGGGEASYVVDATILANPAARVAG